VIELTATGFKIHIPRRGTAMFGLMNNRLGVLPSYYPTDAGGIILGQRPSQSTLLLELIYHCYRDYSLLALAEYCPNGRNCLDQPD
jgi:hypothetical protein